MQKLIDIVKKGYFSVVFGVLAVKSMFFAAVDYSPHPEDDESPALLAPTAVYLTAPVLQVG